MATIDSGDIIRIAWEFVIASGDAAYLIRHYQATQGSGGSPTTILDDIATYIEAVYELNDDKFEQNTESEEATLYKWDSVNERFDGLVAQALTGFIGDDPNSPMPGGNAALGKIFTDLARRQSRVYFFGQTEAAYTSRLLTAAYVTSYLDILDDVSDIMVSDGITLQPVTFNVDPTSPLYETVGTIQNSYAVETIGSYRRSRKEGVGV